MQGIYLLLLYWSVTFSPIIWWIPVLCFKYSRLKYFMAWFTVSPAVLSLTRCCQLVKALHELKSSFVINCPCIVTRTHRAQAARKVRSSVYASISTLIAANYSVFFRSWTLVLSIFLIVNMWSFKLGTWDSRVRFGAKVIFPFSIRLCAAMCTKATMENLFRTVLCGNSFQGFLLCCLCCNQGCCLESFSNPYFFFPSTWQLLQAIHFLSNNTLHPRITQFLYGNLLGNLQSIPHCSPMESLRF